MPVWAMVLVVALILAGGGFLAKLMLNEGKASGPTYPKAWDSRILPYTKIAEKQRGLLFKHPVAVRFLPPKEFEKTVTTDDKELDKDDRTELKQFTGLMRALGLISGDVDLFAAFNDASGAGTLAYYSFDDKRITVRGQRITPAMRSTLVHELTHVLQDQNFDIGERMKKLGKDDGPDTGEESVLDAIIEGDATRVETELPQLTERQAAQGTRLRSQRRGRPGQLPHEEGPEGRRQHDDLAVHPRRGPGDRPWRRTAGTRPSTSCSATRPRTRPPCWTRSRCSTATRAPRRSPCPKLADGEKKFDSGEFGVLTWYFMLAERLPLQEALAAADGWGGDSYVAFQRGDQTCARLSYEGETSQDTTRMLHRPSAVDRRSRRGGSAQVKRDGKLAAARVLRPGNHGPRRQGRVRGRHHPRRHAGRARHRAVEGRGAERPWPAAWPTSWRRSTPSPS